MTDPIHIASVQLDLIARDEQQPRKHFDEDALKQLGESIVQNGLIQPIVVRPNGEGGQYKIIAGERRHRAAKLAGLTQIPVLVREDLRDTDINILQVLENLQRQDLTLAETCAGVTALVNQIGSADTARKLGKSDAWVSKHNSVSKMAEPIQHLVTNGKIESIDIARELDTLLELDTEKARHILYRLDPSLTFHNSAKASGATDQDAADESGDDENNQGEDQSDPFIWFNGKHQHLSELSAEDRERYELKEQTAFSDRPVTRQEVRLQVLESKAMAKAKEEKKAQQKAEREAAKALREAAKNDPAIKKQLERERAKKEKEKDLPNRIKAAIELTGDFAKQLSQQLNARANFSQAKRQHSTRSVIQIEPPYLSIYQTQSPPAKAESATYSLRLSGRFDQVGKAAKVIDPELKLQAYIDGNLTLIEAKQLHAILGHRIQFRHHRNIKGTQLQALADRAAPQDKSPGATAPQKGKPKTRKGTEKQPSVARPETKAATSGTSVSTFIQQRVKAAMPLRRLRSADLHQHYLNWCSEQGIEDPIAVRDTRWGQAFEAAGIQKIRSNGMHYVGIEMVTS